MYRLHGVKTFFYGYVFIFFDYHSFLRVISSLCSSSFALPSFVLGGSST